MEPRRLKPHSAPSRFDPRAVACRSPAPGSRYGGCREESGVRRQTAEVAMRCLRSIVAGVLVALAATPGGADGRYYRWHGWHHYPHHWHAGYYSPTADSP